MVEWGVIHCKRTTPGPEILPQDTDFHHNQNFHLSVDLSLSKEGNAAGHFVRGYTAGLSRPSAISLCEAGELLRLLVGVE